VITPDFGKEAISLILSNQRGNFIDFVKEATVARLITPDFVKEAISLILSKRQFH
jgi:hypothetical protein